MENKEQTKKIFESLKAQDTRKAILDVGNSLYELQCVFVKIKHIAYNLNNRYSIDDPTVPDKFFVMDRADLAKEIWILGDYISEANDIVDKLTDVI